MMRTSKDAIELLFCWPSTAAHAALSVICFPSKTPLEKTTCKWLSTEESFWVRSRGMCPLLFSVLRPSSGADLCRPSVCCLSLYEFIYVLGLLCLKDLVSMVSSSPGSYLKILYIFEAIVKDIVPQVSSSVSLLFVYRKATNFL